MFATKLKNDHVQCLSSKTMTSFHGNRDYDISVGITSPLEPDWCVVRVCIHEMCEMHRVTCSHSQYQLLVRYKQKRKKNRIADSNENLLSMVTDTTAC